MDAFVTFAQGAVYGVCSGTIIFMLGVVLGGLLNFWIGRHLAYDWAKRQMQVRLLFLSGLFYPRPVAVPLFPGGLCWPSHIAKDHHLSTYLFGVLRYQHLPFRRK